MDPDLTGLLSQILGFGGASAQPMVPTGLMPPVPGTVPPPPAMLMTPDMTSPEVTTVPQMTVPPVTPPLVPKPASLGEALDPTIPQPRPRPAEAPGTTPVTSIPGATGSRILDTLKSTTMPKPPEPQKVSTPHLPALRPIQGGGYFDLLSSLGIGPQQALPGLKLPSTLGQALGGR